MVDPTVVDTATGVAVGSIISWVISLATIYRKVAKIEWKVDQASLDFKEYKTETDIVRWSQLAMMGVKIGDNNVTFGRGSNSQ